MFTFVEDSADMTEDPFNALLSHLNVESKPAKTVPSAFSLDPFLDYSQRPVYSLRRMVPPGRFESEIIFFIFADMPMFFRSDESQDLLNLSLLLPFMTPINLTIPRSQLFHQRYELH